MATRAHRKQGEQVEQGEQAEQVASARGYHAPKLFAIHTARAKRHSAVPVTDANKAEFLAKSAQKAPRTVIEEKNFGSIASAQTTAARFFSG